MRNILFCDQWKRKERALYGKLMHPGMKLYCEKTLFFRMFCDVSLWNDQVNQWYGWILDLHDPTHQRSVILVRATLHTFAVCVVWPISSIEIVQRCALWWSQLSTTATIKVIQQQYGWHWLEKSKEFVLMCGLLGKLLILTGALLRFLNIAQNTCISNGQERVFA